MTEQNVHKSTKRRTDVISVIKCETNVLRPAEHRTEAALIHEFASFPIQDKLYYTTGNTRLSYSKWLSLRNLECNFNSLGKNINAIGIKNMSELSKKRTQVCTYDLKDEIFWRMYFWWHPEYGCKYFKPNKGFTADVLADLVRVSESKEPIHDKCKLKPKALIEAKIVLQWSNNMYEYSGAGKHSYADRVMDEVCRIAKEYHLHAVYDNWISK